MENRAAFSGTWYAADPARLASDLARSIADAKPSDPGPATVRGAILPHAGHRYSSRGIAGAFRGFLMHPETRPRRTVILAPSHYEPLQRDTLYLESFTEHATPLGAVRGDASFSRTLVDAISSDGTLSATVANPTVAREHAVEMFLPYLRHVVPDSTVNAILVGPLTSPDTARALGAQLSKALQACCAGDEPFLIASSDFTHYGTRFGHTPYGRTDVAAIARAVAEADLAFARAAAACDIDGAFDVIRRDEPTICGRYPILGVMAFEALRGHHGVVADYYSSNDVTGSGTPDFVSYATVLYG